MKLQEYMTEYSVSHQNPTNINIHQICVPAIMWSVLAFFHTFKIHDRLSAGHILTAMILIFYVSLKNIKVFFVMLAFCILAFVSYHFIPHLRIVAAAVFVAGWIGQFYGHILEGKKPSFFQDLFFL